MIIATLLAAALALPVHALSPNPYTDRIVDEAMKFASAGVVDPNGAFLDQTKLADVARGSRTLDENRTDYSPIYRFELSPFGARSIRGHFERASGVQRPGIKEGVLYLFIDRSDRVATLIEVPEGDYLSEVVADPESAMRMLTGR